MSILYSPPSPTYHHSSGHFQTRLPTASKHFQESFVRHRPHSPPMTPESAHDIFSPKRRRSDDPDEAAYSVQSPPAKRHASNRSIEQVSNPAAWDVSRPSPRNSRDLDHPESVRPQGPAASPPSDPPRLPPIQTFLESCGADTRPFPASTSSNYSRLGRADTSPVNFQNSLHGHSVTQRQRFAPTIPPLPTPSSQADTETRRSSRTGSDSSYRGLAIPSLPPRSDVDAAAAADRARNPDYHPRRTSLPEPTRLLRDTDRLPLSTASYAPSTAPRLPAPTEPSYVPGARPYAHSASAAPLTSPQHQQHQPQDPSPPATDRRYSAPLHGQRELPQGPPSYSTPYHADLPAHYVWDMPQAGAHPHARRRRGNLPKESTNILNDWFCAHTSYPYPKEDEKQRLQALTGLTISQISNWFINARRRRRPNGARPDAASDFAQQQVPWQPGS